MKKGTHDNDNEELSFISLAAATANVVRYLQADKQKNEQRESGSDAETRDDKRSGDHRAYVEQRLRDLSAFERRVSGNKKRSST